MDGAKKPSGYTSDALIEHSNILLDDIKAHGYESVIDENGKLVDGYEEFKIPQFTVNAVVNWYAKGNADDGVSVGYKAVIKGFKKLFPKTSESVVL